MERKNMGRFAKISENTFNELQLDAGVILTSFDPTKPEIADDAIVCATTGGIKPVCKPTFSDWGEDIDNCPNNTMELKRIDAYECSIGFTALSVTAETIRLSLGAADIDAESGKITPRKALKSTDFSDLWWVGDRSDGGMAAICLKNALSTDGFSLTTTKNGKGQLAVTVMGHVSIKAPDAVPMEFYVAEGDEE